MDSSKTKQQIFEQMFLQLRKWNPSTPESVDRLDPVMKILLELYAHQLEGIDKRIDQTWQMSVNSLISSVAPEKKKWPVPAFTVMTCEAADPVVEVDPHTRFFYREKRDAGQTFYFSSPKKYKLLSAKIKYIFVKFDNLIIDLSPNDSVSFDSKFTADKIANIKTPGQIYIGVDYDGLPSGFNNSTIFLSGKDSVLKQLRWGYWYPGANYGGFYEDISFCPGLTSQVEDLFSDEVNETEWGGLRTSDDLFKQLENNFVILPENFTSTWELGPPDSKLTGTLAENKIQLNPDELNLYWIKIDLSEGGQKSEFVDGIKCYFNGFVALNKNELSTYKYTGGNSLIEIEVPEELDNILGITKIEDSNGIEYQPSFRRKIDPKQRNYTLETNSNRLIIWIDFSLHLDSIPDYVTIFYTVTAGTSANGIGVGQINELYEKHPGVSSAQNVFPVKGAIPAKTQQQIIDEVSLRLRNRDRVLNFQEIVNWIKTFDPRIASAECENSVMRDEKGVFRCILVKVIVVKEQFYSDDEAELLKVRLLQFLKSRSPVNTQYQIEVIR